MVVNGFTSVENEEAAIQNKAAFFKARGIAHHEFVPQGQTINQEFDISLLRRMCKAF
jgi:hypothetical protein